ncbi:MAG TPA: hypothetical protein VMQ76_08130, partial [Terracidiphilus sp.]|nr:hypothetical protein [Terracidiphilus sp.]
MQLDLVSNLFGGFLRYLCLFGTAAPVGHGRPYLCQNLLRVFDPMLFAQCLKLGCAGIPSLSHDEHALLSARAIGKGKVIGWREDPLVSCIQQERKILHMIVTVMSENVEAGQRIDPFCFLNISAS